MVLLRARLGKTVERSGVEPSSRTGEKPRDVQTSTEVRSKVCPEETTTGSDMREPVTGQRNSLGGSSGGAGAEERRDAGAASFGEDVFQPRMHEMMIMKVWTTQRWTNVLWTSFLHSRNDTKEELQPRVNLEQNLFENEPWRIRELEEDGTKCDINPDTTEQEEETTKHWEGVLAVQKLFKTFPELGCAQGSNAEHTCSKKFTSKVLGILSLHATTSGVYSMHGMCGTQGTVGGHAGHDTTSEEQDEAETVSDTHAKEGMSSAAAGIQLEGQTSRGSTKCAQGAVPEHWQQGVNNNFIILLQWI